MRFLLIFLCLVLAGCGRTITAPELPTNVCSRTDTLWSWADTTVKITYWSSGAYCAKAKS